MHTADTIQEQLDHFFMDDVHVAVATFERPDWEVMADIDKPERCMGLAVRRCPPEQHWSQIAVLYSPDVIFDFIAADVMYEDLLSVLEMYAAFWIAATWEAPPLTPPPVNRAAAEVAVAGVTASMLMRFIELREERAIRVGYAPTRR